MGELELFEDRAESNRLPVKRGWLERSAAISLTVVALVPVFVVVLQRAGRNYLPVQDQAVIDLRVRDVFTFSANTPLVGAYDRFGWCHLGPAMYYLVAPFAWIFSDPAWATLVGFALLQGVAVAWTARLAWKTGGLRWTVIWLSILSLSYVATGPWILQEVWNPHVAFPFFVLFLLQCLLVARGDRRRLLGLAFVGSFLVQTHVGYLVLVAILSLWALVHLVLHTRRLKSGPDRRSWIPPVVTLVVMWFPPLVLDPILHFPGNVVNLVNFYLRTGSQTPIIGLSAGLGYLATEFKWLPPWLGGSDPINPMTTLSSPNSLLWLLVPAALMAGCWLIQRRRGASEYHLIAGMLTLLLVASAISLVFVRGNPHPYIFYWRITAGCATVVLALILLVDSFDVTRGHLAYNGWIALMTVALIASTTNFATDVASANGPISPIGPLTASLLSQMQTKGQPDGPAIVRFLGSSFGGVQAGIVDQLSREGKPIYVDPALGFQFGYGRTATPRQVKWILYVTEESQLYSTVSTLPGARVIGVTHPLNAAAQRELVSLQRQLAATLMAQDESDYISYLSSPLVAFELNNFQNVPMSALVRLAHLNTVVQEHSCLCSVIEFPANRAPAQSLLERVQ